jgi:NAD(P)H-dependent FMN reductase
MIIGKGSSTRGFMIRIAIIIGNTRPGRKAEGVAKWVYEIAQKRSDAEFELVDIKDFNLALLDEPMSPITGQYTHQHTRDWSAKIASFDAYVFVTPEYNHATSGALKNAIDFLYHEWVNKAAGFVGYGGASGTRAVENLRLIMAELQIADVKAQVGLSLSRTSRTSASSSRLPSTRSPSTPCLIRSLPGAAR